MPEIPLTPGDPAPPAGRFIDLSMPLACGLPVYPGDPPFLKNWHATLERDGYNLARLELGAHSGTHVDAPLHFLAGAPDVASLPLDRFCGPALAIDVSKPPGVEITPSDLAAADIHPGDIVLFRTGWEARAGTPAYFSEPWPGLAPAAAERLFALGVKAVGGDFPSVEAPGAIAQGAPVHHLFAQAGLPVFECLVNLNQLTGRRFTFFGFPLKISEAEASPIRAVAYLEIFNY